MDWFVDEARQDQERGAAAGDGESAREGQDRLGTARGGESARIGTDSRHGLAGVGAQRRG